jgi:hypothetical protein
MAARIAYQEREEAKVRKAESEMLKQQDKENRKRQQKEDRLRRQSEERQRRSEGDARRSRTRTNSSNEKMEFMGKAYTDYVPAHDRSLPAHVPAARPNHYANTDRSHQSVGKSIKSTWLGFLAWFKTRLLRLRKKFGGGK